tara:strand:+ start:119 stop:577 length:459 start_codon:yes stop_codon:yes gene_type:complete
MMLYETDEDRSNEKKAIQILKDFTGDDYIQLPKTHRVDIAQIDKDGTISAWIEYKHRSHPINKYPSLMITATKLTEGVILSRMTGIPFYLLASFKSSKGKDPDFYRLEVGTKTIQESHIAMGGRRGRGGLSDIEPVCYLDIPAFERIPHGKV